MIYTRSSIIKDLDGKDPGRLGDTTASRVNTCSGSTPRDSRRLLCTRDSNTGTVGAVTMRPSDEFGKTRKDRGVHTHGRRRSASGNRLMDHQIIVHVRLGPTW